MYHYTILDLQQRVTNHIAKNMLIKEKKKKEKKINNLLK
jgi:hypothetical protein